MKYFKNALSKKHQLTTTGLFLALLLIMSNRALYKSYLLNSISLQINDEILNSTIRPDSDVKRLDILLRLYKQDRSQTSNSLLSLLDYELWRINEQEQQVILYLTNDKLYEILISKANIAVLKGNLEEAESRYRFALSIKPNSALEWHRLGNVLWLSFQNNKSNLTEAQRTEKIAEIVNAFEESILIDQNNPEYLDSIGWLYFSVKDDPSKAIYYLSKAIDNQNSKNPWTIFKLGLAYRAEGDFVRALELFELAEMHYAGSQVDFLKQIADIQWRLGNQEAAINTVSLAISRQPKCGELYLSLSIYLASACQIQAAEQAFSEGIAKNTCSTEPNILNALIKDFEEQISNPMCK